MRVASGQLCPLVAPVVPRRHCRRMASDDADRLGPKGHVYVELVREQWRAPLERASARRALLTFVISDLLIALGIVGAFIANPEALVLVGIGVIGIVTTLPDLKKLRPEFEESRRIGWVEPMLDDSHVVVGEPATITTVLHARKTLTIRSVAIRAECRRWQGDRAGDVLTAIDIPAPKGFAQVKGGDDWRQTMTFRIAPTAPPSVYTPTDSVRWTLSMSLTFADEQPWQRTWPMLVFPQDHG